MAPVGLFGVTKTSARISGRDGSERCFARSWVKAEGEGRYDGGEQGKGIGWMERERSCMLWLKYCGRGGEESLAACRREEEGEGC